MTDTSRNKITYTNLPGPSRRELVNAYMQTSPYVGRGYIGEYYQNPTAEGRKKWLYMPATQCDNTEYESKAGTKNSDRVCSKITNCEENEEYEKKEPTPTSDRECRKLTTIQDYQMNRKCSWY